MAVFLSPVGGAASQFFDNNGDPLSGGKLHTYAAGTTTPQPSYTTSIGNVAHTNPIILDAAGRVPGGEIWLTSAVVYKFSLTDADDVLIGTYDNISSGIDAADVTFQPAGNNAVTTNVQFKLRQTVSVMDFGAVGDGSTDDTIAIQNALDSGANAVYFPNLGNTNYKVTDNITVPPNVQILGEGTPTVTAYFSSLKAVFSLAVGASIYNISIVAANRNTPASTLGVLQGYLYDPNVTAVEINTGGTANNVSVTGAYLGFSAGEKSNIALESCSTLQTGWGAVSFYHCSNVRINNGTYYQCGGFGGVMLPSCQDFSITNIYVYNPTGTGINPGGSAATDYNVERGVVTGCVVEAGDCINFENGAVNCAVTGNTVTINSALGLSNGVGIGFLSHSGGGPVSSITVSGNSVVGATGGEGVKFGVLNPALFCDRVIVTANVINGTKIGIYYLSAYNARDCQIANNTIGVDTGGIWLGGPAERLVVKDNNITTSSGVTINNYYGVYIFGTLTDCNIEFNVSTGWGVHYYQTVVCPGTQILNISTYANEIDGGAYLPFSSTVSPAIGVTQSLNGVAVNGGTSLSITPTAPMGLIALNATVAGAAASNQSSQVWMYMSSIAGANTGYTSDGISVVKITGLKHDFAGAIADCGLVGSTTTKTITISAGGFDTFSLNEIPLFS